uniref:Uncharacterized protein n=1 Tax=Anguilla anguilla TaxID=7936 RepID=A0A0E9UI17_ANGAN
MGVNKQKRRAREEREKRTKNL